MEKNITVPEDSHMPLVIMTVLTQVSLGGFFALFLGDFLFIAGFHLPAPSPWMSLAVLMPSAIGLSLSVFHLGRPLKAPTALINLKTSWLSREALALAVFTFGMVLVTVSYFMAVDRFFRFLWEVAVLGTGIYGIFAQSMIYRLDAHPSWNGFLTTAIFFGTGYVGVLLLGFSALIQGETAIVGPIISLALLFGALQIFSNHEYNRFLDRVNENHPHYAQLRQTSALLMDRFDGMYTSRQVMLYLGAIGLPLIVAVLLAAQSTGWAIAVMGCSLMVTFISELIGRYLFFATGVSVGLP